MNNKITLRQMDDMHCHFRTGSLLKKALPFTAKYAGRGIAMPNTQPRAILTADDVVWYQNEISNALNELTCQYSFEPLMTIEIRDSTTPRMIKEARHAGAIAGKVYPLGITTNSDEGLQNFFSQGILKTFHVMQDIGMLLLIHGEIDQERILVTKREETFLPILIKLAEKFPNLKIVLEHISTKNAVNTIKQLNENVSATITAHHLCLTLNDVLGYGIQPHHTCMPIPKDFDDRDALIEAATSSNPKFFLGSDTAPHPREKKECVKGACGIFTAPVLPQVLAEVFEKAEFLNRLEDFTSRFGANFYSLPLNAGAITLTKTEWTVPEQIEGIVPFRAGTKLQWQLA